MPLDAGSPVPEVVAENQDGEVVRPSADERSSSSPRSTSSHEDADGPTVLYFYPRDDTPGCTTEAQQFQAELEAYREAGVSVYGVSTDTVDSHREFAEAEGFEFDLLADPEAEIVDAFDVDTTRGAATRTTFVLLDGEVWRVYENVAPDGHARDVLGDLLDAGVVDLPD